MRVQALQTGTVTVRPAQLRSRGWGSTRQLHVLLDTAWADPIPILAWAIDHPEGVIVVDTGETAQAGRPGYWPAWHPYYRRAVRVDLTPEQEIGPQLAQRGIAGRDVATVVLTHLHTDHAGGLHHFPRSRIVVHAAEYRDACGLVGRLRGYLPHRWPSWFAPVLVEFAGAPVGPFAASHPLTRAGDVVLVPTPGHTRGHASVIVRDGDRSYFLAGDATYSEHAFLAGVTDGVCSDATSYRRSLGDIREWLRRTPAVFLPSHDPAAARRLCNGDPTSPA